MSKNISIPSGITVIGNSQDSDLDLAVLNNNNINSFKTLIDGVWKSWSLGTPDAFQGFATLNKGFGYVVNAAQATDITFDGVPLDVNTLNFNPGLNILALPYDGKAISDGYLPRFKISTMKTIDGSWKSWSEGTPDAYQGFTALDDTKGYVCNIDSIFDAFLDNDTRDINDGITLGKVAATANDSLVDSIDGLDHWFEIKNIESDVVITVDETLPKKSMYVEVDGKVRLLEFPQELLGSKFIIRKLGYDVIDYRTIDEAQVGETTDYGLITDPTTEVIELDRLDTIEVLAGGEFEFTFVENTNELSPSAVETLIIDDVLEFMYDRIPFDNTVPLKLMNIEFAGLKTRLSFAAEYAGNEFVIIKDNMNYPGVFTESEAYIVL